MSFTHVQGTGAASTTTVNSQSASLTGVSAGNLLVVEATAADIGGAGPTITVTDSQGNTYTPVVSASHSYAVTSATNAIFSTTASGSGSVTVTVSSSVTASISFGLNEWSSTGTPAVDGVPVSGSGSASTSQALPGITLSGTDMVVACFHLLTSGLTYTAGSGFSVECSANSSSGAPFVSEYDSSRSASPVAPAITTSGSTSWSGVAAAFTDATAAPTAISATDQGSGSEGGLEAPYAVDQGSSAESAISASRLVDSGLGLDREMGYGLGGDASLGQETSFGLAWGGDSGLGQSAERQIFSSGISIYASDLFFGDDSVALLIALVGDMGLADESWIVSSVAWAMDSGLAGSVELSMLAIGITYTALDPSFGSESAPSPTAWGSDAVDPDDAALVVALGGEQGGESETGPGSGSVIILAALILAADAGSASEAAWWSNLILGLDVGALDQATAGEVAALDLVSAGYHVYVNAGVGDPINYSNPVGTVLGFDNVTWTSPGLAYPGTWKFGVRAFDAAGEEKNVDCVVTIVLDTEGNDITGRPAPPSGLRAFATAGGGIRVEWLYPQTTGARTPVGFHVYCGTPAISYATPAATIPYSGGFLGSFQADLSGLSGGSTYVVGVRAYNGTAEEPNTVTVTVTAGTTGPGPVLDLVALPVA